MYLQELICLSMALTLATSKPLALPIVPLSAAVGPDAEAAHLVPFEMFKTSRGDVSVIGRYAIPLHVGTPRQTVYVLLDTGSNYLESNLGLWFLADCTNSTQPAECEADGTYDPKRSSSALHVGAYEYPYGAGPITGEKYIDDIIIAGAFLSDLPFGVIPFENVRFGWGAWMNGILGLSYGEDGRNILIDALIESKHMSSRYYSMYADYWQDNGEILFSGVDNRKFEGELKAIPLIGDGNVPLYKIQSIGLVNSDGELTRKYTDDEELAAAFNMLSGTTLTDTGGFGVGMPSAIRNAIARDLFPEVDESQYRFNGFYVDCEKVGLMDDAIRVWFDGFYIDIPVWHLVGMRGEECYLLMQEEDLFSINSAVLQSHYMVFDREEKSLLVATSLWCGENIIDPRERGDTSKSLNGIKGECEGIVGDDGVLTVITHITTTAIVPVPRSEPTPTLRPMRGGRKPEKVVYVTQYEYA